MQKVAFTGILFLAVIIGAYFAYTQIVPPKPISVPNTSLNNDPSATTSLNLEQKEIDKLLQGGASYSDKNGVYSFLYPLDYVLDELNGGEFVRISKKGDTQQGQTEMYDGVTMVFQSINLGRLSLEGWVDQQIDNSTADGTVRILSDKRQITINGYPGFTYTIRSLGESTYYVLQKDESSGSAVSIAAAVADPQKVGFQKEVDAVIASVKMLK